jgi:NADH dehydrogenase
MPGDRVTVFGGTGYLGRRAVHHLVQAGYRVRAAVRHPQPDLFQNIGDAVEQTQADVTDAHSITSAIQGAVSVVNTVGLYVESGATSFQSVHVEGAREVALQSAAAGVQLVHISGIGADPGSESRYVAARAVGEQGVRDAAPNAVILRPSVLFGPEDAFLCTLLNLVRFLPIVPLFGTGAKQLQPVYVDDVAKAIVCVLGDVGSQGKTFELGGPRIYTYRELLETVTKHLNRKRLFLPVPFLVWKTLAAGSALLPNPPLTRDQIILMRNDNVVSTNHGTFCDLGIIPQALEDSLSRMT